MLPILYSYRRCPFAMRARMALKLAGMEVEIREISLHDKPASMLKVSPKATVPVLVLADGTVIDESIAIMQWALEQAAFKHEGKFDALQANTHKGCSALVLMNDTEFKKNLDGYKYPERNLQHNHAQPQVQAQLEYRAKGEVFLQRLETLLQQNIYLFAATPSFADYAIFPFIRQFAAVDSGLSIAITPSYALG
jgi:glutathione S-transferase